MAIDNRYPYTNILFDRFVLDKQKTFPFSVRFNCSKLKFTIESTDLSTKMKNPTCKKKLFVL